MKYLYNRYAVNVTARVLVATIPQPLRGNSYIATSYQTNTNGA